MSRLKLHELRCCSINYFQTPLVPHNMLDSYVSELYNALSSDVTESLSSRHPVASEKAANNGPINGVINDGIAKYVCRLSNANEQANPVRI
jgi:hypothetical protein